jgi:putative hydrolase of the HAD superfamily
VTNFDAILFDAGGIFVLPDPTVLCPLLSYYGGSSEIERYVRAHYRAMAVKSHAGAPEGTWDEYHRAYVDSVGVPAENASFAATVLGQSLNAYTWRWPIADSIATLAKLGTNDVPLGVVSNASGQIVDTLQRAGVCQEGPGPHTPVRVIIDSHVVGVTKPDPRIFDFALSHFDDCARARIAYVGDSVTMDVGGARAAGLHPILLDPYDDHLGADFDRIHSLQELL